MDFAVMYSTGAPCSRPSCAMRTCAKRRVHALNIFLADTFRDYADRMTPAAVIPMHTPAEAVEELDHVKELGLKVVMMSSLIRAPGAGGGEESA